MLKNQTLEYKSIIVERGNDGVDRVTLNRPDSLNSLNTELSQELRHYFEDLYQQESVRLVVLKGSGRGFCAGLDLFEEDGGVATVHEGVLANYRVQLDVRSIILAMRRCPQPIIALVKGPASGGGFVLSLAADIRIAGESAKMNAGFVKIGLSGSDIGVSYLLPRMVGLSIASEMLLTGRAINAKRALQINLVSKVVPDDQLESEGEELVAEMMKNAPFAMRMTKDTLNWNVDANSLEAALALEDRTQVMCGQTKDFDEGYKAFKEKRAPKFTGE